MPGIVNKIKQRLNASDHSSSSKEGQPLEKDSKRRAKIDFIWLTVKYLILAVAIGFVIRGFLLIPVPVAGSSMASTLSQGDMVAMEKLTSIERFDVIVFQQPDGSIFIKRVVGLPGESVVYENDHLIIDGKVIDEPFLAKNQKADHSTAPYTTDFSLEELIDSRKLPEGSYFVLGDNRRISKDSRSFGAVDSKMILGKVRMVYYPLNHLKLI